MTDLIATLERQEQLPRPRRRLRARAVLKLGCSPPLQSFFPEAAEEGSPSDVRNRNARSAGGVGPHGDGCRVEVRGQAVEGDGRLIAGPQVHVVVAETDAGDPGGDPRLVGE